MKRERDSNELFRRPNQHDLTYQEMPNYSSLANPNSNEDEEAMQNESDIDATFEDLPEWIESSENFNSTYDEETMLNDNDIELRRLRSRLAEKDATIQNLTKAIESLDKFINATDDKPEPLSKSCHELAEKGASLSDSG